MTIQTKPEIIKSVEKTDLSTAMKFARAYSQTFRTTRVVVENFQDANGVTVWKNSTRAHDDNDVILFFGGKRKKANCKIPS